MIIGAHAIIYSRRAAADRRFLRDVLRFSGVDAGDGWLIFALPPSELAVHPADQNERHELYLICDDVQAFTRYLRRRRIRCSRVEEESWGSLTRLRLPGGGSLGVYEPKHPRPGERSIARKSPKARRTSRKVGVGRGA